MISSKDISIVLQGPIYEKITAQVSCRMRELFPESEIILSTWIGSKVDDIHYDYLLLNDDPGSTELFLNESNKRSNNTNRMIVSTLNGIKKSSRKYCLRWRTDLLLKDTSFLKYFDLYPLRSEKLKIFNNRLLVHSPTSPFIYPYGPTDISCFGYKEDVFKLWNIPLQSFEEASWYFNHKYPSNNLISIQEIAPKRGCEMYLWYTCLSINKKPDELLYSDFGFDFNEKILHQSELSIVNNFIIIPRKDFDFESLKHPYILKAKETFFTQSYWKACYYKYCDDKLSINKILNLILYKLLHFKYKIKYILPLNKAIKSFLKLKLISSIKLYNTYRKKFYKSY